MAAILAETSVLGSGRDHVASQWLVAWVCAPGPTLSIHTLTSKVTVSGQGHENVENSKTIFAANARRTGARLRALVRVRDLRRIVQLQRCILTPSNRGWGCRKGGCKTVRQFRQNPWHVACLHVCKIYRWFV